MTSEFIQIKLSRTPNIEEEARRNYVNYLYSYIYTIYDVIEVCGGYNLCSVKWSFLIGISIG